MRANTKKIMKEINREARIITNIKHAIEPFGYIDDIKYDYDGSVAMIVIHIYGNRLQMKLLNAIKLYGFIDEIRTHAVEGLTHPVFCIDLKPRPSA